MKTKKILAGALAAAVVTTSLPGMGVPVFAADSFLTPDSNCYTTDNPFAFPTEAGEVQTLQAERATTLYNKESNDGGYPMKILTNNDRTYVKDMLKNGDYATYAYTAEAGLYLVTAHYYCGGDNTMILSDAGTKNNNVNTVLMSVGTTNSQWKTKQFLLKINNTGAGTLKIASTNENAPYLDKLEITKMQMTKYEGENRFAFPTELNAAAPATLEAEYGIITNHIANDDGDYPAQEKMDNDRGQAQWAGNGYYVTSVNTGDSVAYAYHAEKPGIYAFTARYRSGSNDNHYTWSSTNNKIVAGSVQAGHTDSSATQTKTCNKKLAVSLNRCLKYAKGKYIARMDADDESLPQRLEVEVDFLERHEQVDLVGCNRIIFDEQGEYGIRKVKEYPTRDILIRDTPFAHPTIMMRKKVYDALGGYRVAHKNMRAEDLDLWIRFFEAGYKGYNIQEVLYRYHESRDDLYKRSVKVAIHTMAAFWYGYRVLNVPFYKRIWVLKPLVAALIPKWIMEKYHRIRLDKV